VGLHRDGKVVVERPCRRSQMSAALVESSLPFLVVWMRFAINRNPNQERAGSAREEQADPLRESLPRGTALR